MVGMQTRRSFHEKIIMLLHAEHPDACCALHYTNPLELLVATILSAQCTDERVNAITPMLFRKYPTAESLAASKQKDVEKIIKPLGFFRAKATNRMGSVRLFQ